MSLQRNLSRYELLEEIGRGNMGVVYKARDPAINRTVAIKVVRLGFSLDDRKRAQFLERFEREARIAGGLNHANIIAVHDVGLEDEPYLVMEHFAGVDLGSLVANGPLHPDEVRHIAMELSNALAYAHAQGVVHRDIKPANVLYQPGGAIKLVDFGIAKLESSELTATGEFFGTPSYMSPEIFSGDVVDGRSDLFSLGVVLYLLLTGSRPFDADTVSRTIYRVLHDDPESPSRLQTGISPDWDIICARLLAKKPKHRYPDANALRADLERLGEGRLSTPPATGEPTIAVRVDSAWTRRFWMLGAFAGAVVLLVALYSTFNGRGAAEAGEKAPAQTVNDRSDPLQSDVSEREASASSERLGDPGPAALDPLVFVARHEHRIGHCTGDLTLTTSDIRFVSSRHDWRWPDGRVQSLERRSGSELELVALDEDGERESFQFTFLRPALSPDSWARYEAR